MEKEGDRINSFTVRANKIISVDLYYKHKDLGMDAKLL